MGSQLAAGIFHDVTGLGSRESSGVWNGCGCGLAFSQALNFQSSELEIW